MTSQMLPEGVSSLFAGYSQEPKPLGSYGGLVALYNAALGSFLLAAGGRRDERVGLGDLLLAGTATHKLSRLLAKDRVTSVLRAPFTEYQEDSGQGEVEEKPRGSGWRLALGELLVCPYCLAQWVAGGFLGGLVLAPRRTRLIASVFTAVTIADFLQLAYKAAEDRAAT